MAGQKKLNQLYTKEKEENIKLQINAGLTHIKDPLLNWDDMFRPFSQNLKGVEVGSLDRFFENNTFYKTSPPEKDHNDL